MKDSKEMQMVENEVDLDIEKVEDLVAPMFAKCGKCHQGEESDSIDLAV